MVLFESNILDILNENFMSDGTWKKENFGKEIDKKELILYIWDIRTFMRDEFHRVLRILYKTDLVEPVNKTDLVE